MTVDNSLRARLRSVTTPLHRELDGAMAAGASVRSPDGYVTFLRCMEFAHGKFGALMDDAAQRIGIPLVSQALGSAVRDDLAAMGEAPASSTAAANDGVGLHPMGIAYALEGSSMGANFLLKELLGTESTGAPPPHAYLQEAARGARSRWPAVCMALEDRTLESDEVIESAERVFQDLLEFLRSNIAEREPTR